MPGDRRADGSDPADGGRAIAGPPQPDVRVPARVQAIDLGRLGVADRWADPAVAAWSTAWNHGPGWDGLLFDTYGVSPDRDRIRYYRLLWDLGP
jgi:hypothetical protein